MKFSHFFIERPRFATVISSLILIFGALSYFSLPVSQYPEIVPPQVQVTAAYPGANAETIAQTVATPLEQEINGVQGMIYMSSQATNSGTMDLSVTFEPGTDIDTAQVLVQNRVSAALSRLPEQVQRIGVTTTKSAPDILMAVHLYSPDDTFDQNYIGNYASLEISDRLSRLSGIGNSRVFGAAKYSMRVWLNPKLMSSLNLTSAEVINEIRKQNLQVAGGVLNQTPSDSTHDFQISLETQGRLVDIQDFEEIIVKAGSNGGIVQLKDIARIELGAETYTTRGYLGKDSAVVIILSMRPGSNALETANAVKSELTSISQDFPEGLEYRIAYNPTEYIAQSINEVFTTLFVAIVLVILVILVFLQSWRTAIIPVVAIPISLIGTFGLMFAFGYSLNMLSLFGLILAIGIVVDDAIVVVENVERRLTEGMDIISATKRTMDEVGSALIATSLVLVAVFLPTVLIDGISGQFYQQFGVTIAASTMISTVVSLTLSPAMAAIFMKDLNKKQHSPILHKPIAWFNNGMDSLSNRYGKVVAFIIRRGAIFGFVYLILITATGFQLSKIPTGFIPKQDQGYMITIINLPSGATLDRTNTVVQKAIDTILTVPGVKTTAAFAGFSPATRTIASHSGAIFIILDPMEERRKLGEILSEVRGKLAKIDEAFVIAIPPPSVRGMGNAGGFKMMVQDRSGQGPVALEKAAWALAMAANKAPETTSAYTFFETNTPRMYLDIDRERARLLNVPLQNIFDELEINIGSSYVNDFTLLGRSFRVTAQADIPYRVNSEDILNLNVRSESGSMVPIGSIATIKYTSGPTRMPHYNLYPAAAVSGSTSPGFSSGQALDRMEQLAEEVLPPGFSYEWTEIAYQERSTGKTAIIIFSLAVLFVFLLLSAQYESWTLPLAIILIVPMCLLSAGAGLLITGFDNNILTQVGLVVLIGLASKNAILIVEFAKQYEDNQSMTPWEAAIEACRTRLRPILMTAISFILGVMPLLFASSAGFEMRQAIGLTVFSGMLGVTLFGLLFTPLFYVFMRKLAGDGVKEVTNKN